MKDTFTAGEMHSTYGARVIRTLETLADGDPAMAVRVYSELENRTVQKVRSIQIGSAFEGVK